MDMKVVIQNPKIKNIFFFFLLLKKEEEQIGSGLAIEDMARSQKPEISPGNCSNIDH